MNCETVRRERLHRNREGGSWAALERGARGLFLRPRDGTAPGRDGEEEIASFKNSTWTGGGTLAFPDGRQYLANTNFWQTQYEFTTLLGEPLIHFRNRGLFGSSAEVTILPGAREMPELPWMVALGWYLIIMMQNDTAAAT